MNIQTGAYKAAAFPAAFEQGAVIIDADGQAFRYCQEQSQWLRAYDGDWLPVSAARMDTYRECYASWIVIGGNMAKPRTLHSQLEGEMILEQAYQRGYTRGHDDARHRQRDDSSYIPAYS